MATGQHNKFLGLQNSDIEREQQGDALLFGKSHMLNLAVFFFVNALYNIILIIALP